ncbi:MAG: hypothetical protein ACOYNY_45720 [Caldilineaceae bacterium]
MWTTNLLPGVGAAHLGNKLVACCCLNEETASKVLAELELLVEMPEKREVAFA